VLRLTWSMALRCHSALLWTCAVTLIDPSGVSAGESSAHAPALTARSTLDESVRTLPVFYDSTMTAKGFPSPFLRVRIGEHEATFLVDSGASTHVFADWFVKAAGIPSLETDSTVQGSSGKSASERTVHQLHGAWSDGRSFNLDEAVVVSFPDFFESLHIGGLLSPQLLAAPGSAAVLNLKIPSFHFLPFAQAVSELRRSKSSKLTLDRTRACQNPTSHFKNREYVAPVSLGPVTDLMLVDTGATKTILSRESKLAQAIDMRSEPGGCLRKCRRRSRRAAHRAGCAVGERWRGRRTGPRYRQCLSPLSREGSAGDGCSPGLCARTRGRGTGTLVQMI
jgi:hypothetical protein